MSENPPQYLHYERCRFTAQLPVDCLYSPSHFWIARRDNGLWRVGFTKFATRLLGEMVDHGFQVEPNASVIMGQIIGWVEGFKAISDLNCMAEGRFVGGNPALMDQTKLLSLDPFGSGWLYEVEGKLDPQCVDVDGYREILDKTIDKLAARQEGGKKSCL